ncbi:hypothetical protein ACFSUS_08040 [Spirosoma soli]|uniref:T9SS type A sorting domain-containing protein n=1 Tax=Spirosoma soli TaxID=1770529 RepID=A0ABW5M0K8_9BACT
MKTLIKPLLFALTLGFVTSVTSFSEANPIGRSKAVATYKTGIYATRTGKLNIALDKQTGGTVDIRLRSNNGTVLYSKHLGKNERMCRTRLNLNDLEDGVYQVEITNGVEVTRQTITLSTKQPALPERTIAMNTVASN